MPAWSFRRVIANVPGDLRVLHVTAEATVAMHGRVPANESVEVMLDTSQARPPGGGLLDPETHR